MQPTRLTPWPLPFPTTRPWRNYVNAGENRPRSGRKGTRASEASSQGHAGVERCQADSADRCICADSPRRDPCTTTNDPLSLDETFAQPRHLSWDLRAAPTSVVGPLRSSNICREAIAQLRHLSFRTQRSGVRNLKPMFSKRRFAACTAPMTMAEHTRFLAMLGTTSYRPAVQTLLDGGGPR